MILLAVTAIGRNVDNDDTHRRRSRPHEVVAVPDPGFHQHKDNSQGEGQPQQPRQQSTLQPRQQPPHQSNLQPPLQPLEPIQPSQPQPPVLQDRAFTLTPPRSQHLQPPQPLQHSHQPLKPLKPLNSVQPFQHLQPLKSLQPPEPHRFLSPASHQGQGVRSWPRQPPASVLRLPEHFYQAPFIPAPVTCGLRDPGQGACPLQLCYL